MCTRKPLAQVAAGHFPASASHNARAQDRLSKTTRSPHRRPREMLLSNTHGHHDAFKDFDFMLDTTIERRPCPFSIHRRRSILIRPRSKARDVHDAFGKRIGLVRVSGRVRRPTGTLLLAERVWPLDDSLRTARLLPRRGARRNSYRCRLRTSRAAAALRKTAVIAGWLVPDVGQWQGSADASNDPAGSRLQPGRGCPHSGPRRRGGGA